MHREITRMSRCPYRGITDWYQYLKPFIRNIVILCDCFLWCSRNRSQLSKMNTGAICLTLLTFCCLVQQYVCEEPATDDSTLEHAAKVQQEVTRALLKTMGSNLDDLLTQLSKLMSQEASNKQNLRPSQEGNAAEVTNPVDNGWDDTTVPDSRIGGFVGPASYEMPVTSKFGRQIARLNAMT